MAFRLDKLLRQSVPVVMRCLRRRLLNLIRCARHGLDIHQAAVGVVALPIELKVISTCSSSRPTKSTYNIDIKIAGAQRPSLRLAVDGKQVSVLQRQVASWLLARAENELLPGSDGAGAVVLVRLDTLLANGARV